MKEDYRLRMKDMIPVIGYLNYIVRNMKTQKKEINEIDKRHIGLMSYNVGVICAGLIFSSTSLLEKILGGK